MQKKRFLSLTEILNLQVFFAQKFLFTPFFLFDIKKQGENDAPDER